MKQLLRIFLLLTSLQLVGGFEADTLLCTSQGLVKVGDVSVGDRLVQYSSQGLDQCAVVRTKKKVKKESVTIVVGDQKTVVSVDQMFYLADQHQWKKAKLLRSGDFLQTIDGAVKIEAVVFHDQKIELYDLMVDGNHTFCITKYGIIVHNWFFGLSLAFAFGGGSIQFTGISASICALGVWLTQKFTRGSADAWKVKFTSCSQMNCCAGGPDPDDEEERLVYKDADYHHKNSRGQKSPAPQDGQAALDNSVRVNENTRIGMSENEFVVLNRTAPGQYHGHVRTWKGLADNMRQALLDHNIIRNLRGKMWK